MTGVQTCALPISLSRLLQTISKKGIVPGGDHALIESVGEKSIRMVTTDFISTGILTIASCEKSDGWEPISLSVPRLLTFEIGRASCRERV